MYRFHKRNAMPVYGCFAPSVIEERVELDGSITTKVVRSNEALPPPENFDLDVNIRTKTNLDQVSTKICKGNLQEVCAEALAQPEFETEIKNDKE